MNEIANIELRTINQIDRPDYTFFIPSYQRGYRWDLKQVNEFLDDLKDLMLNKRESYCLQPIVVKALDTNRFEVIDGQQRLTTIYLLLLRLRYDISQIFTLRYESRKDCCVFFKGLKQEIYDYDSNPDFAHMSGAYKQITGFVDNLIAQDPDQENELRKVISDVLEIIWYELPFKNDSNRQDSIKIFTRLNIGKIPLTSAELIKAILLSTDNLNMPTSLSSEVIVLNQQGRQIELANEWNQMESELQNHAFWNFINKDENKTPTHIDFLFDLVYRTEIVGVNATEDAFTHFYKKFTAAKANPPKEGMLMAKEWDEVKSCFSVLREWYKDKELYHLLGYLIWAGKDILDLYILFLKETKTSFVKLLAKEVGSTLRSPIVDNLYYGKDSNEVMKVLVLLNMLEAKESKDASLRFPFERLKLTNNRWSLEHIHAQNSGEISQKDYLVWIEDHENILKRLTPTPDVLLDNIARFKKDFHATERGFDIKGSFEEIAIAIMDFLSRPEDQNDMNALQQKYFTEPHHISNMALLDRNSNSSLSNGAFAVKREKILHMDRAGVFIPQATRNVFLKYYSDYPDHLIYWTFEDKMKYLKVIKNKIKPFFNN